jgi:hypothetical protein
MWWARAAIKNDFKLTFFVFKKMASVTNLCAVDVFHKYHVNYTLYDGHMGNYVVGIWMTLWVGSMVARSLQRVQKSELPFMAM